MPEAGNDLIIRELKELLYSLSTSLSRLEMVRFPSSESRLLLWQIDAILIFTTIEGCSGITRSNSSSLLLQAAKKSKIKADNRYFIDFIIIKNHYYVAKLLKRVTKEANVMNFNNYISAFLPRKC